jgi:hypothetical protein
LARVDALSPDTVLLSPGIWGLTGVGPQALNAMVAANNPVARLRQDNFVNITESPTKKDL